MWNLSKKDLWRLGRILSGSNSNVIPLLRYITCEYVLYQVGWNKICIQRYVRACLCVCVCDIWSRRWQQREKGGINEADMEINERVKINQSSRASCIVFIHIWPSSPLQIWLPCFNYRVYFPGWLCPVNTFLQYSAVANLMLHVVRPFWVALSYYLLPS